MQAAQEAFDTFEDVRSRLGDTKRTAESLGFFVNPYWDMFFLKGDVHRSDVFGTCLKEFDLNCAYFAPGKFKPKTIRQGLQSTSTCIYVCQKIFTTFNCN
jgi:hypothetical protein